VKLLISKDETEYKTTETEGCCGDSTKFKTATLRYYERFFIHASIGLCERKNVNLSSLLISSVESTHASHMFSLMISYKFFHYIKRQEGEQQS
jgi:hypothetical protein